MTAKKTAKSAAKTAAVEADVADVTDKKVAQATKTAAKTASKAATKTRAAKAAEPVDDANAVADTSEPKKRGRKPKAATTEPAATGKKEPRKAASFDEDDVGEIEADFDAEVETTEAEADTEQCPLSEAGASVESQCEVDHHGTAEVEHHFWSEVRGVGRDWANECQHRNCERDTRLGDQAGGKVNHGTECQQEEEVINLGRSVETVAKS